MKKTILTLLTLLAGLVLYSQTIRVQAPNLVGLGEQFNVSFIIESEHSPSSFSWQCGDEFSVVWGPQEGKSTSISIVNGKTTKSSQTTYTYILEARQAGSFRIPAAEARIKGETVVSRETPIDVVGDKQQSHQSGTRDETAPAAERESSSEDIFMRLHLSKTNAVLGETVSATLKLYQRVNISGFEDAKFPDFEGFWAKEVQTPTNIEFRREKVGGEIYNAAVIRSWSLVAQSAGEIKIDPAELVCLINVRAPRASTGSILDDFFMDDYRTVRKRLYAPAVTVRVKPLPSGAPASFCGAVGKFQMNASVTRDSLKTHDAASLKVIIRGEGNTALVEAPRISFPPDFEVYDVKTTDTDGGKIFEYPFIPRSHGDFVLGPVEYSYYDISQGKYVTLKSGAMPIAVKRGEETGYFGDQNVAAPAGKKDIRNLGNDIRYIETHNVGFRKLDSFLVGSPAFWMILAAIIVLAAAFYLISRRMAARKADVVGSKRSGATKMARKRLSAADAYLKQNLYSAYYEELHKALLGYVSDALNMDMSDMSKENISSRLMDAGAQEGLCKEYVELLDACEFARYAPSEGQQAMNVHFEKAVSVISAIDGCMHNKKKNQVLKALPVLLLLCLPFSLRAAAPADSLWVAGVESYAEENYFAAVKLWEGILESGVESPELYYNLGNAQFKMKEYAKAIVSYKRALRLDPTYEDAEYNLEFAESRCLDRVEAVPQFFLKEMISSIRTSLSSDAWAVLFLVLSAVGMIMLLMFLLGSSARSRKVGFFVGIALLILASVSIVFSVSMKKACVSENEAVVMVPVSSVKSSPGESSIDLFVLHEGISVKVIENVGTWVNVSLSDGRQGWVKSSDVTIL